MIQMPLLKTPRLLIRPFFLSDLPEVHRLLDVELRQAGLPDEEIMTLEGRAQWLQWSVLNYDQLAQLNQPPYGDRGVILRSTGQLIGACGFVPCLMPFEQLPGFVAGKSSGAPALSTTEFGLFYSISPEHQRLGYASEAVRALVDYAFQHLQLKRVIATTTYDNVASVGVMRKLGMRIEKNPHPEPPWMQVVGVLEQTR